MEMIEQNGIIVRREGNHVWVEFERQSSCSDCSSKGCGVGLLGKVLGRRIQQVRIENSLNAAVGEKVVVGITGRALLRGSIVAYLWPLLGLFVGGLCGAQIGGSSGELLQIMGGVAGFAVACCWCDNTSDPARMKLTTAVISCVAC